VCGRDALIPPSGTGEDASATRDSATPATSETSDTSETSETSPYDAARFFTKARSLTIFSSLARVSFFMGQSGRR
jgi:hypothetical protein